MAKYYDEIPPKVIAWILKQKLFWVATAPLDANGKVNLSPKSLPGTFHVVDANQVWYEDLTGSGSETIAHVRENRRITIMFTAFDGAPNIVRLWGKGTIHEFGTPEYDELIPFERRTPGSRSAIVVDVEKVGTSCGYAVPFYEFKGHRETLLKYAEKCEEGEPDGPPLPPGEQKTLSLRGYWQDNNTTSLDGLPALAHAMNSERPPKALPGAGRVGVTIGGVEEAKDEEKGERSKKTAAKEKAPTRLGMREEVKLVFAFAGGLLLATLYFQYFASAREWIHLHLPSA